MPRICTVCAHPDVDQINSDLLARVPLRDIAGQRGLSKSAVDRHAAGHLPELLARAADGAVVVTAGQLVGELRSLGETMREVLAEARSEGNHAIALRAAERLERQAELCGRLAGELVERHEISARALVLDAEWIRLRGVVLGALQPFPDALAAVRLALLPLGGGNAGS